MSALATAHGAQEGSWPPADGEPTLDEVLVAAWERLAMHRSAQCPACGGEMRPEYSVHALPVGGRCQRCGTRLS